MLRPDQLLVIYDGECPFCSGVVHVLRRLDWRDRIVCLPYQTIGLPEAVGTVPARARHEALAFSPSGRLRGGFGAVAACLDALLPFGLPLFRTLYLVPGLRGLLDRLYEFLSENRGRLPSGSPDLAEGERPPLAPEVAEELARRRLATHMPTALPGPGLHGWLH